MTYNDAMHIQKVSRAHLAEAYGRLKDRSRLDLDFVVLTAAAAAICSFGFRMDNASVIVGAMVISPLLYSVVSTGVATHKRDAAALFHGIRTLLYGIAIAAGVAAAVNLAFATDQGSEIAGRLASEPLDYFFVAFFSGIAGTFAFFWPDIVEAIAGIAISVALIPPIVIVGIGLATRDASLIEGGSLIVVLNVVGIYLGSLLMFAGLRLFTR